MSRAHVEFTGTGRAILVAILILMAFGIASIYVTDTHYAADHDGPRNALKQCVRALLSMGFGLAILRIGYQNIGRYAYGLFFAAVVLLVPLLIASLLHTEFGGLIPQRNGAHRWINLPGFLLQPSEVMKITFVIALAWYLRFRKNYRRFAGLMVPIVAAALPLGLILLEPDLGTCLLMGIVLFIMLFAAGARIRHMVIIVGIGVLSIPIAWNAIEGYQRLRVAAVLLQNETIRKRVKEQDGLYASLASKQDAEEWAVSSGYQLVHSKNAVGSGGLLGHGWGSGNYVTSTLLPDRHNDFIFAIIAHQWGFLGSLVVLICYAVIAFCGVIIALETFEPFARLLAVGITAMITAQVLINISMTLGLMPITGMTLPFVSYGGSSLLSSFAAVALLISVARHRPFTLAPRPFEHGEVDSAAQPVGNAERRYVTGSRWSGS